MDRRTTLKWVLAASTAWPLLRGASLGARADPPAGGNPPMGAANPAPASPAAAGYGTDPNLLKVYHAGDLWPLTFTPEQRRLAAVLSDLIIPADEHSGAASSVGVVEFIDEWVSAPYPAQLSDRPIVLEGFAWLDAEGRRRFGKDFADLSAAEQGNICDEICDAARARPERRTAAQFFARYRDLTAGAFYSTPVGRSDLGYIGNVPLSHFEGAPPELLKKLDLS
jgi:hypothetical protein